jgi:catechol 2,3-dioxygenase-like lactoylglutathione lyase family enzyme
MDEGSAASPGTRPIAARAGELGVHSLDHFALVVPNLAKAQDFYAAFGLDVRNENNNDLGVYTHGSPHRWLRLIEGGRKRLHYLSFGVFEDDMQRFKKHLPERGVGFVNPPHGMDSGGLWIRDLDGTLIEIAVAPKTALDCKSSAGFISSPAGVAGAPKRSRAPRTRPSRLAHCLTFTRDVSATIAFYADVLGLRLSDRSGSDIAFMHARHGSEHHVMAFARSHAPGLHHCAWDVASLNDIGLGAMQMASRGYTAGWGLGRHVLGSNYFHYVRDPYGSYCEYSCDMDYIAAGQPWTAGDHEPEDAFYVWGPRPPLDWTLNYEADPAG